jgi:hypothetical protein
VDNIGKTAGCPLDLRLPLIIIENSPEDIKNALKALKVPTSIIDLTIRLKNLYGTILMEKTAAEIFIDNKDILDLYSVLLMILEREKEAEFLNALIKKIKDLNLPGSLGDLKIKGEDLVSCGIPEKSRALALKKVLIESIEKGVNDREGQMKILKGVK